MITVTGKNLINFYSFNLIIVLRYIIFSDMRNLHRSVDLSAIPFDACNWKKFAVMVLFRFF